MINPVLKSNWTRRSALQHLSAGALLSLGLWPAGANPPKHSSNSTFRFIVVNDTHYMGEDCAAWLQKVVQQMKSHSTAEFCLLVGDLVENGHRADLGAVADIFSSLRIPLYTQIGNHDYLEDSKPSAYEAVFPNRLNYSFEHHGWQFVAFDSTEGTKYDRTTIQPPALAWLRDTLPHLDRSRPMVLLTHFPLAEGVRYRPLNAADALDLFRDHNLRAVFNGHFHGSTENKWKTASLLTHPCCALKRNNHDATNAKGYVLCEIKDGQLTRKFIEVPA